MQRLGLAVIAAFGILLSAWYILTMLQRVIFNPLKEPEAVVSSPPDVTRREFFAFGTLAGLCLLLGLFPQPILETMQGDVQQLSTIGTMARSRVTGVPITHAPIPLRPGGLPKGAGPKAGGGRGGGKANAKIGEED